MHVCLRCHYVTVTVISVSSLSVHCVYACSSYTVACTATLSAHTVALVRYF
jgi:hypothetical protein